MTGRTRFWASLAPCVAAVFLLTVPDASLSAPKSKETKETEDSVRKKCMAKVNDQVAEDFPRWREHLLTHCIEKGGKL
jgi:hypothetical protein